MNFLAAAVCLTILFWTLLAFFCNLAMCFLMITLAFGLTSLIFLILMMMVLWMVMA